MMTILVTGVAGFIGFHTAKKLLEQGYTVIGIDNFDEYYDTRIKYMRLAILEKYKNFTYLYIDIRYPELLKNIKLTNAKIDNIIHLAALPGVRNVWNAEKYISTNVIGTINIIKFAHSQNISHISIASSSSVYSGCPDLPYNEFYKGGVLLSPYAISKHASERICEALFRETGINITLLRFFSVYGPYGRPDMFIWKAIDAALSGNELIIYGDGTQARDWTYIDDITNGIIKSLDVKGFEVINLGNNKPISINEIIRIVMDITQTDINIQYGEPNIYDMKITYADIEKAKKVLGWQPKTDIETGLKKTVDWFLNTWIPYIEGERAYA